MAPSSQHPYQTKSAVLLIIYSRTDTSLQVLAQIRRAKPTRLYITADGPRTSRPGEDVKCAQTRTAILAAIDWDCEVKTLFRDENMGPKEAISSAMDWFFANEEEGIIFEHDCLPADSFFMFCDALLEKYRFDKRVWLISGCNLQHGKRWGDATYYFSNLTTHWGFATWKRSWEDYDKTLSRYNNDEVREQLANVFDHPMVVDEWERIFKDTKSGKINTWDYQVTFAQIFGHAVSIIPNYNLTSNIGFGEAAENTLDANHPFASLPLEEITEIIHPTYMIPQKGADMHVMEVEFLNEQIRQIKKHNAPKRRVKRWFKGLFKKA